MKNISRRAFSGAFLAASAAAADQSGAQPGSPEPARIDLPEWKSPESGGDAFALPGPPSPRTRWAVAWAPRKYFAEWLPALFERTLAIDESDGDAPKLPWIFTGPSGGFTVKADSGKVRLAVRYYDSPGLGKVPPVPERPGRHPEGLWEESSVEFGGGLKAITVVADHRLTVRVLLNGKEALTSRAPIDVNRHQLALASEKGSVRGRLLPAGITATTVDVDDTTHFQSMIGWGGTATPPAFAELSPQGTAEWWRLLAEYNLLLHREYPTGAMLNREMTNWDRPSDASPHYYGDNFPNCETSNFEYIRQVQGLTSRR